MMVLSLLLCGIAALGILYLALAGAVVLRFGRGARPAAGAEAAPPVTILKPLHGAEPGLAENLATFLLQDYPAPVQVIFGVQRPHDPAVAVVRGLQAAFPDRDIDLVIDGRAHGTNRKVSNLANMAERARHPVIVMADSDMRVGPDYLAGLWSALSADGVGAVTCLYHGIPDGGVWARLMALGIDVHFLPGVAMGVGLGIGHPCMGSTVALRRETLDRIGGFRAIADELADDHALGAAVRRLGLEVAVTRFTVGHVCSVASLTDLADQELRWVRTIRQIEPGGHAGAVVTHPLAFALAAFAAHPGSLPAATVAAVVLARIGLCLAVERAFGLKAHRYWLLPARDILSFAVYAASFFGRGVSWRGYRYDVARSGVLRPRMNVREVTLPEATLPQTRPDAT